MERHREITDNQAYTVHLTKGKERSGFGRTEYKEGIPMKKIVIIMVVAVVIVLAGLSAAVAAVPGTECMKDRACQEFARLAENDQFDAILAKVDPNATYSSAAKDIIGQAYLMIAGKEGNTPEQEEMYCRKALEYGATSAYMGLYFIHAGENTEEALGYLREYVATKPNDAVPYVLLGESELEKGNYATARTLLENAKKLARGRSSHLDWLLFQAAYLTGDYALASNLLDSAIKQGYSVNDLKTLLSDPRFNGLEKRPEFRKCALFLNKTTAKAEI